MLVETYAPIYQEPPRLLELAPRPLEIASALEITAETELARLEESITALELRFVELGQALQKIRDKGLFKVAGYKSFAKYAAVKWGLTATVAQSYIKASRVYNTLLAAGYNPASLPPSYSLYRAWASLDEEEIAILWQDYIDDCDGEPNVTSAAAFIKEYKEGTAKPKTKKFIATDIASANIISQMAKGMDTTPGEVIAMMIEKLRGG